MVKSIPALLLFLAALLYAGEDMIKLPQPNKRGNISLEEAILKRRSVRSLSDKELSLEQISQLLWSCQGITDDSKRFRSAPSAGATFPLEVYVVKSDGLFQYVPKIHGIKRLKDKDLRPLLSEACYNQGFVKDAASDIVICADFNRTTSHYGTRGRNYVYIEVGHAAQNLHLQAVAEGLGSVAVGAFSDDKIKKLLDLPEDIVPIYVIPVGYIQD